MLGAPRAMSALRVLLASGVLALGAGYKAAYFEYTPRSSDYGAETKQGSLADYARAVEQAAGSGVQIIVFPEYGITGWSDADAAVWQQYEFSEIIPPPSGDVPCATPNRYGSAPSIVALSCMAKNHTIALVANLMDYQDGRIYNTDVAFDTDGSFKLKYHKLNRWGEKMLSIDDTCKPASFTTSFGVKFGVMTCADLIWEHPGMDLIRDGVTDFAVPVGWDNTYAQFQIVAYLQGWSAIHGVNIIVGNGHQGPPSLPESGSGIFASGNVLSVYSHPGALPGAILRIADVPKAQAPLVASAALTEEKAASCANRPPSPSPPTQGWRFAPLSQRRLCSGSVCCEADVLEGKPDGFVLAVLDGVDLGPGGASGSWPAQACAVLPCSSTDESCLYYQAAKGHLLAVELHMSGAEFCSSFPAAQVLGSDSLFGHEQRLLQPGNGSAGTGTFRLKTDMTTASLLASSFPQPAEVMLSSALIYVRRFDLDGPYLPYKCGIQDCACGDIHQPVCGTDGKTHNNSCEAECVGSQVQCQGMCPCGQPADAPQRDLRPRMLVS